MANFVKPVVNFGSGVGFALEGDIYTYIQDPIIRGPTQTAGYAYHMTVSGTSRSSFGGGITGSSTRGTFNGNINMFVEQAEGWVISDYYTHSSHFGVFFLPAVSVDYAGHGIANMVFTGCQFKDTQNNGEPVRSWSTNLNYMILQPMFYNCYMQAASNGGYAYQFDNPINRISIVDGTAESTYGTYPINFGNGYNGVICGVNVIAH